MFTFYDLKEVYAAAFSDKEDRGTVASFSFITR